MTREVVSCSITGKGLVVTLRDGRDGFCVVVCACEEGACFVGWVEGEEEVCGELARDGAFDVVVVV